MLDVQSSMFNVPPSPRPILPMANLKPIPRRVFKKHRVVSRIVAHRPFHVPRTRPHSHCRKPFHFRHTRRPKRDPVLVSIIWASVSLFREKCSFAAKAGWLLVILSVPILGPIFYKIRFKT